MVPSLLRQVVELPLTANGKVDAAKLRADARKVDRPTRRVELSPTERRVAVAWAEVLDVPWPTSAPTHTSPISAARL